MTIVTFIVYFLAVFLSLLSLLVIIFGIALVKAMGDGR